MVAEPYCNSLYLHSCPFGLLADMSEMHGGKVTMRASLRGWLLMLACVSGMALGAPETGSSPKLDLLEFQVEGNTVLSQMAIEEAVYPLLGPGKSVADVEKARVALEQAYHDAGYLTVYVSVPEQKVNNGVVVLKVTEGVIVCSRVSGVFFFLSSRFCFVVPSFV